MRTDNQDPIPPTTFQTQATIIVTILILVALGMFAATHC